MVGGFDPSGLYHNGGYVYRLIELVFGDFIGQYGQTNFNNAGVTYTIIAHLGFWSCIAAMVLVGVLASSAILNAYRWTEDPQKHLSKDILLWYKMGVVLILIVPASIVGNSLAQRVGVLKVALMGDSFANMAYSSAVTEMLTPPTLTNAPVNATKLASAIFKIEVCTWGVQSNGKRRNKGLSDVYKDGKIQPSMSSENIVVVKNADNQVLNRYNNISISSNNVNKIQKILFAPDVTFSKKPIGSYCGSINFPIRKKGKSVFDKVSQEQNQELKKAVIRLANNLSPAAYAIFQLSNTGSKIVTTNKPQVLNIARNAADIYTNSVNRYIQDVRKIPASIQSNVLANSGLTNFIKEAGWGLGVIWWKLLADTQNSFIQTSLTFANSVDAKIIPICTDKGIFGLFGQKYCIDKGIFKPLMANIMYMNQLNSSQIANNPNIDQNANPNAEFDQICNNKGCSFDSVDSFLGSSIMKYLLTTRHGAKGTDIYNEALTNHSLADITKAENQHTIFDVSASLGANLANFSATSFGLGAVAKVIAGVAHGVSTTVVGFLGIAMATEGISAIANYAGNYLWNAGYLLAIPAYTLLVVLPFLPIIIWGTLILSYLIMLIEAYIAVNLGMALWVVPDEQFISSRVIRTVMMLCALLLRPFLFVVGLATSYALAPIALNIWNVMFFWGTDFMTTGNFLTSLALISVYIAGLIKFTLMCYNVSFILPDKILQWMGSGYGDIAAFGSPADFGSSISGGGGNLGGGSNNSSTLAIGEITKVVSSKATQMSLNKTEPKKSQQLSAKEAREIKYGKDK